MATTKKTTIAGKTTPQKVVPTRKQSAAASLLATQSLPSPSKKAGKKSAPPRTVASPKPSVAAPTPGKAKDKLVRDSFTIPKSEYAFIELLKTRAANLKRPAKKSEILRAGIALLRGLDDAALLAAINAVPSLKTGRPKATNAA